MHRLRALLGITVFWLGLSILGDAFVAIVVAQRIAVLAEPATVASAIGLITSVGLAVGMLVQPIAGAVSDALRPRWGRRAQLLIGAGLTVLALGAFGATSGLLAVAVTFVLIQVSASIAQAAQQGFIPDLVESRWRGRAAGLKGLADLGGAFIGFTLLAAVLTGPDVGPAVVAVAVAVAVTAVAAALLVREPTAPGSTLLNAWRLPREAFRLDFPARSAFVRVVLARFTFLLGIFVVGRFFLLFVAERLGIPPGEAGAAAAGLLAGLTLITAIGAVPSGWLADRAGRTVVMLGGAILGAVGAAALLTAGSALGILVFGGVMALGSAAFSTANWALAADLAPPDQAGRVLGLANLGTGGAAALAGLFGPVVDVVRPSFPGLGYGGFVLIAVALMATSAVLVMSLRGLAPKSQTLVPEAHEP